MQNIFFDIGLIIIVATIIGFVLKMLKQPLIPAYVLAGIIIGPVGLGLISDFGTIKILAEIGIAFLLFVVGLELDFKKLRETGLVAIFGGLGDVMVLGTLGFVIALLFGVFTPMEAVYIGIVLAFSSTMVVVKILSDSKQITTLHGRIIVGILLMQDILAIFALSFLSTVNNFSPIVLFWAILKALIIILAAVLSSKFIFPSIFKIAAESQELLFLASITACFAFAMGSYYLGFSIAIGAFAAGIALANLPYNFEIIAKVKPLRDFFATVFFVTLGMELVSISLAELAIPLVIFTVFVLVGNSIKNIVFCKMFGYSTRTAFHVGMSLSQVSEFSLIIVSQGLILGHVSPKIFSLTVFLAVITMSITPYMMKYSKNIFQGIYPFIKAVDKIGGTHQELSEKAKDMKYNVIVLGSDRLGYSIIRTLEKMKKDVLVIDFNPDVVRRLNKEGIQTLYGDIGDPDILERLNLEDVEIVVSTIPDPADNEFLIKRLKSVNKRAVTFVTANKVEDALALYEKGADYVILPHFLGGSHVSVILQNIDHNIAKLIKTKLSHIEELRERRKLGHEHPHHERHRH